MKLSSVKNAVTSRAGRQILQLQKNSPVLLFGAGIVGFAATVVVASKATLTVDAHLAAAQEKLKDIDQMEHVNYTEEDRRKDKAIVYAATSLRIAKLYGPAVFLAAASITCLTASHSIQAKRNAGLMAAYAALEKGFNEYRKRVVEEFGEDKDRDFRYGSERQDLVEQTTKGPKTTVVNRVKSGDPSIYARFFDECSTSWSREPEYNLVFVRCQQNYANDMLRARGHVFLNEVYDMLGIERTKAGAVVGWVVNENGDNFIDFGVFDGDNPKARDFVNGREGSILLDFNVDGVIYDKI